MKVLVEIDDNLIEDEIVIKCKNLTDEISAVQKAIKNALAPSTRIVFERDDKEYYLSLNEILFFETDEGHLNPHTKDSMYEVKRRLYELEEELPGYFVRVSKSSILNVHHILSISKNLAGASEVEFIGTPKRMYVSRNYYKMLQERLDSRR